MKTRPPIHDRATYAPSAPIARPGASGDKADAVDPAAHQGIRRLVWIYFWLLLLEGAIRKWIFPQFSDYLLIIRDPIVLLIYIRAVADGIFPRNGFIWTSLGLAGIAVVTSAVAGQYNFLITLYGLRTSFLHLPLIFLIPRILTAQDVEKAGRWLLITAIPMAILVVIQFRSAPDHWINSGVTGVARQLTVGFGKIRPPGTFSFTNGLALYLSLLSAFLLAWQIRAGSTGKKLVIPALLATGIMIGTAGSRGVLTAVTLILAGMLYFCVSRPNFFGKGVRAVLLIGLAFVVLQFRHEFRLGMEIYDARLSSGGGIQQGLIGRQLSGFIQPIVLAADASFFGAGIGMGTTVASQLLWGKKRMIFSEGEWERIIMESGPVFGFLYLGLRIALVVVMAGAARRGMQADDPLPLLLFCATAPNVLVGQWGVPTGLGFAALGAGFCLASAHAGHTVPRPLPFQVSPDSVTNPERRFRGRSIYSEKLHGR